MNPFSELCICKTFGFKMNPDTYKSCRKNVPLNSFGVFVTAKRSSYQKINRWPEDIHGCQGFWTPDYKKMTKDDLLEHMVNVADRATSQDERKDYFPPITRDAFASYEVYFMLLPLIPINSDTGEMENGELFNNKDYGIIYQDSVGNRATFLPHVFKDKPWKFIKEQIIGKAHSSKNAKSGFVAYRAKIYSSRLIDLFNQNYLKFIFGSFATNFINSNYKFFVPYEMTKNKKTRYVKEEYVRNLATLNDFLRIQKYSKSIDPKIMKKIERDVKYYAKIYEERPVELRQASAFLLLSLYELEIDQELQQAICNHLYNTLKQMDRDFELGECLIALASVCPDKGVLLKWQKNMEKSENSNNRLNEIFRLNWDSKYLFALWENHLATESMIKSAYRLAGKLHTLYQKFWEKEYETNYLAVCFEAFCSLLPYLDDKYKVELLNNIFSLFYLLQLRHNDLELYEFKNNTARIDITGHVLNGLFCLRKLEQNV